MSKVNVKLRFTPKLQQYANHIHVPFNSCLSKVYVNYLLKAIRLSVNLCTDHPLSLCHVCYMLAFIQTVY